MKRIPGSLEELLLGAFLLIIGAGLAWDASSDLGTGASPKHILMELVFGGIALAVGTLIVVRYLKGQRKISSLHNQLEESREAAERWQKEHASLMSGLGAAIDKQFEGWKFSPAEKEIALLILKGLSLKEIAEVRATSERTVRQQSLGIYAKAGLKGRAELSAFFMEDLILPSER